jgi:hypothetical protein
VVSAGLTTPDEQLAPPPFDQFLVVPIRVHLLKCDEVDVANCHLTDADVGRILGKVNGIWHQAGIHFGLESLVHEPAARVDAFRALLERHKGRPPLPAYGLLMPDESRDAALLHVYYIHAFAVNGVYLGDGTAVVQETAQLRPVEGGIDEPLPRVTAHELGHALGLPHRQARTNLLASGTTGTTLNEAEVKRARDYAVARRGVYRTSDLLRRLRALENDASHDEARRLRSWLGEIPGFGAAGG